MSAINGPFLQTNWSLRKVPILHVTFAITRPNRTLFQQDFDFWVDSGFDADIKMPQSFGSRLQGMGLEGIEIHPTVADRKTTSRVFVGQILNIELNNLQIPATYPIDCSIMCMGLDNTTKLIGLNALERWNICLDIPQEVLSVT